MSFSFRGLTRSDTPPGSLTCVCVQQVEEDRYKEMLDRSDSANIASSYFKSKRASQLLAGESAKGHGETTTASTASGRCHGDQQSVIVGFLLQPSTRPRGLTGRPT